MPISRGPRLQLLHEPPRRVDFRLGHPAVGFGDMAHELEGGAEELLGYRRASSDRAGRARRRTPPLWSSMMPDDGADHGPPDAARGQQNRSKPRKMLPFQAHSR